MTGEFDADAAAQFSSAFEKLPDGGGGPIEVDLGGVTFIDSSGLRVLLGLAERVTTAGGTLAIKNASTPVRRILSMTGLESTFGLTSDTES